MAKPASVFLDANILIYFLDETAQQHQAVIATLQRLVDDATDLYTSHHVIEEVLFIVGKLSGSKDAVVSAVQTMVALPGLVLIEPDADVEFAIRYARLWQSMNLGVNDALLLQLMVDARIKHAFSYDTALLKQVKVLGISAVR